MAMIESAFKAHAHSRAKAHGFWQFMTERESDTGSGRRAPSTSGAIREVDARGRALFRDLYEMFGDWYLAMAAYRRAKEGPEGTPATGAGTTGSVTATSFLRKETRDYVPFVSRQPSSRRTRSATDSTSSRPPMEFEVVPVGRAVDLARVAEASGPRSRAGAPEHELQTRVTPHGVRGTRYAPESASERLVSRLASLPRPSPGAASWRGGTGREGAARARVSVAGCATSTTAAQR